MHNLKRISSSSPVSDFSPTAGDSRRCKPNAFLFFLCLLLPALTMAAQAQFEYTTSDSESIVTGYSGPGGDVVIPDELGGSPVRSIENEAFRDNETITSITIPDGVTSIGDSAFRHCTNLASVNIGAGIVQIGEFAFSFCTSMTSITLPDGLTFIGIGAFNNCTGLTSITIPESMTSIGDRAFQYCTGLINIFVDEGNSAYSSLDGTLFDKSQETLVYYPGGKPADHYTIPDNVTTIGGYAFQYCLSLSSITILDSVTSIGDYAFSSCTNLTTIIMPESLTSIGVAAFFQCRKLSSIAIPDSVTSIGDSAFVECGALTTITIPDGVTSISDAMLGGCYSLTSVNLSDSLKSIGSGAFSGCWELTSITIPDSVTSIDVSAFSNCINLQRIYFAGDGPIISNNIFSSTPSTLYYLPGSTGWTETFAGRPTVLWNPQILTGDGVLGVQDGKFGFTISGAADVPVVVEACSDLADPNWTTVAALTFNAEGTVVFRDPNAADQPGRYYRFRPE